MVFRKLLKKIYFRKHIAYFRCREHRSIEASIRGRHLGATLEKYLIVEKSFKNNFCTHNSAVFVVVIIVWLVCSPVAEISVYDLKRKKFFTKNREVGYLCRGKFLPFLYLEDFHKIKTCDKFLVD